MIMTKPVAKLSAEKAMGIVQDFIFDQLGHMITVGQPCHVVSGLQSVWSVPLVLTSPGYGIVGIVGTAIVDIEFGHIIGWTPLDEVRINAETLTDENEAKLEAAFQMHRNQYSPSAP